MVHQLRFLTFVKQVRFLVLPTACYCVLGWLVANAWGASLTPLTSFGNGDGWLAPGEDGYAHLTTTNDQRGMAYGNGHLYLVNKAGGINIRILDPATGADLGALDATGISGGTFPVDAVAVADDGAIYVANLTTQSTDTPYTVYKWATEASTPIVAYSGDAGLAGSRIGDDLAAIGSGASTLLAAGYATTPSVAGNNGYAIVDPTAGTATAVGFTGTPPNAGDFRLGITFTDSSHVIGTQGNSVYGYTSFSGSTGTFLGNGTLNTPGGSSAERFVDYTVINNIPYLAVQSSGDAHVAVYSIADPLNPVFQAYGLATTGTLAANGNATGAIAWAAPPTSNPDGSFSQVLYAMRTNAGIQAFTFTTTPPTVPGDYDGSGTVDAGDYVIWRKTDGLPATPPGSGADGDGSGTVGPEDFDFWRARFGNPNPGSGAVLAAAVPEPGAFALTGLSLTGAFFVRRRRSATVR